MTKVLRRLGAGSVSLYFLRLFFRYFFLSLSVFAALFIVLSFVQIINEEGVINGFSWLLFLRSVLYLLPNIFSVSAPFALVMGCLLSVGELSGGGELTALRAGGYSYYGISSSLIFFALFLSVLLFFINNIYGPEGVGKSREYVRTMFTRVTNIKINSGVFEHVSEFRIYAGKVYSGGRIKEIKLFRDVPARDDAPPSVISISAEKGSFSAVKEKGIRIDLASGVFSQFNKENREVYVSGTFNEYSTFMPFAVSGDIGRQLPPRELDSFELLKLIKAGGEKSYIFKCGVELVSRLFFSLAPLPFILLASGLGFMFDRESKSFSFVLSVGIIFLYYSFTVASGIFADSNRWAFPWGLSVPFLAASFYGVWIWLFKLRYK